MRATLFLSLLAPVLARPSTTHPRNDASVNSQDFVIPKAAPREVHANSGLEISSPNPEANPILKRFTFTAGGRHEYCGESYPDKDFGPDAPLEADCRTLYSLALAKTPGFYTLTAADFDPVTGWATIVASGTCSVALRFDRKEEAENETVFFGTHDVAFYLQRFIQDAKNGRIGAVGGIACYNGTPGKLLLLNFGIIKP